MKTYNFKPEFAGLVERDEKLSTIRVFGKRQPPVTGEQLRFYTGMRTKKCRKLGDRICRSAVSIRIHDQYMAVGGRIVNKSEEDQIARVDGFLNAAHLRDWFRITHKSLPVEGWLICWNPERNV